MKIDNLEALSNSARTLQGPIERNLTISIFVIDAATVGGTTGYPPPMQPGLV